MLKVIPLGGLGEVGMNTMVFEHAGRRLLVDCGLMFPRADQLGVEVVVPDFSWLKASDAGLDGVVLTHAHEDHLGALPWLLRELNVPVWGTPFTLALARHRLEEAGLDADLREIGPRTPFHVGEEFQVEALRVTHSVPDAVGLFVRTRSATAVHTGDFKLDGMPIDGQLTDLERLGELGEEGVDLLLSDSTNAEVEGTTPSEQLVRETFRRVSEGVKGRLVVTLFGSHLHRVAHLIELGRERGRKVLLLGRSLQRNVRLAQSVGIFEKQDDVLVPFEAAPAIPRDKLLIVATGAQAEVKSALNGLMAAEPGPLRLEPGDTVIVSARAIPGNEPMVSAMVNRLLARGMEVITPRNEPGVHVSGHAARDEQQRVLEVVKPRGFVPIHGELHQLHAHRALARKAGFGDERTLVATDGDIIAVGAEGLSTLGRVPVGQHLMRREGVAPVSEQAMAERRWLAESGAVIAVVVLQVGSGKVLHGPVLQSHALGGEEAAALALATESVRTQLAELSEAMRADDARVREEIIRGARRVFKQLFGSRPTIVPIVVRIP
ncbi:MAG: ribonuclease J [Myxococcaceae bacterium]